MVIILSILILVLLVWYYNPIPSEKTITAIDCTPFDLVNKTETSQWYIIETEDNYYFSTVEVPLHKEIKVKVCHRIIFNKWFNCIVKYDHQN